MMQESEEREAENRKRCTGLSIALVMVLGGLLINALVGNGKRGNPSEIIEYTSIISPPIITEVTAITPDPEETDEPIKGDPNNLVYPYSLMSTDWGGDIYDDGYTYYEIPKSYKLRGGLFPQVAQVYLWCICRDAGVDYYMVLAMIERESGYRYDATGDNGRSKGLMQIQEKWHKDRMEALGAEDLYNPYDNMRVGVDLLKEIQDKYLASSGIHCVLMVYNMGSSGARKLWEKGIYSTEYTRQILQRAQELKWYLQER